MPPQQERWMVWNDSPHHYCHDRSLFFNLDENPSADRTKDFMVLGKGDVVIPIIGSERLTAIRLRDVFYYKTDKPSNIINLKLLQCDYPKLVLSQTIKIGKYGTAIEHADDTGKALLIVDEYDREG
ncbi:uncharacterized protein Z520_03975 [Fonsecaea multimorphosa CBS 102226]|uniref:Uncharacterized protein n=1 Tax=Fonsecaea multimorphosa CBS 102226 TaxID=1442371 RepID=A0A0D2KAW5_9EURO|nr:uncharacterized protein Z520_03975 [Fonsecaea multimorphosa CBS 102226]KIY00290.1 hypothetical protein Z520_03975 [Fonsecaea multimorphosa CBS 102226]OAL27123.1 hypothetical protein AYO22_03754 [Fonsecaea multimorphosa]